MNKVFARIKQTEIGPLPEEWNVALLGSVAKVQSGFAFSGNTISILGEVPIIRLTSIGRGRVLIDRNARYLGDASKIPGQFLVTNGDLLIAMTGGGEDNLETAAGRVGKYIGTENALLNQRVGKIVVINSNLIDREYLYFYLSHESVTRYLASNANGSAQSNLTVGHIENLVLSLPPLLEQSRIASILSSLDDKIELNRKMNANLEQIASALFKRWFVDFEFPNAEGKPYRSSGGRMVESELGEIPEGWNAENLGKFFPIKTGKKDANVSTENGLYPFFSCSQGILHTDEYSFDSSSILLTGNGDFNVKWYEGKFEAYQRTYVLTPYEKIYLGFLFYAIKYFLNEITAGHRGSVIRFITKGMIENFRIAVPLNSEMIGKVEIFNEINKSIDHFKKEIFNLESVRDSILPRLMSGRIRVKV